MKEEAIILMEPGAAVNGNRLSEDAELRETCEDIFLAQLQLAKPQEQLPDVEAKLEEFHDHVRKHRRLRPYVWSVMAAAAAIVAAVYILRPKEQPVEVQPTAMVFVADHQQKPVTVQTADGTPVPVQIVRKKNKPDATVVIGQMELQIEEQLELSVPHGESLQLLLPDGTRVYLHPGSRLVYPSAFVGNSRQVRLTGEAYFCVAHDASRPFMVNTPQGVVCDYGTEFNVSTRMGEQTEVVLVEGSVGVTPAMGREQLLTPGQKCSMSNGQCSVSEIDVDPYISWRDGYFHFEEATLGEILKELGRYYNLSVVSYHPDLLRYRMRFIIPRDSGADYAVKMLNRMGKVSLTLDGDSIIAH